MQGQFSMGALKISLSQKPCGKKVTPVTGEGKLPIVAGEKRIGVS